MAETIFAILLLLSLIATPVLAILLFRSSRKRKTSSQEAETEYELLRDRLAFLEKERLPLTEVERRAAELERKILAEKLEADQTLQKTLSEIDKTRATYKEKRSKLNDLLKELATYDERLSLAEHGVYEPHFDFSDSAEFQKTIRKVRTSQKKMVSNKSAVKLPGDWTVDGSLAKGRTMANRQSRLTLRAFNNECEAAIANARWNNVQAMERRIRKSADAIDRANASIGLAINKAYLNLRLEELFLTHEYREKQKEEKEERAELARAEREEKKLLAEAKAAEKEEQKYQKLLDKARQEALLDSDDEKMKSRIAELEAALEDAHSATERAKAMAERTKTGYVYIISNVGSFGDEIVKIGLTRRLNPDDRVKELGDASVPFGFDTHAIIYSEEAPALESALHREFESKRVNAANMRKEFFRVGLEEVENAVKHLAPEASFFSDREAQEYQETLAMRNQLLIQQEKAVEMQRFPDEI